jgi:diguanylate cyclase (GGDEF)-like protein
MAHNDHCEHLLAIIDVQTRITATKLDLQAATQLLVEQAQALTGADAAVLELTAGDELVYAGSAGTVTSPGGAQSMIGAPVLQGERPAGELKIYSAAWRAFESTDFETLQLLSGVIGAHMTAATAGGNPESDRHDALTGLGNRRAYEETLEAECSRARRHGGPMTLCLLHVDGLSQINEEHGRPAGDEVLRQVGQTLERLRAEDVAFRIGGDRFAVLLPATDTAQARVPVERLAAHIGARAFGAVRAAFGLADSPLEPAALHATAEAQLLAAQPQTPPVAARA